MTIFQPTWESLKAYHLPEWFRNAKLGIFIHWGVYSVPAFGNEWYAHNMYRPGTAEYKYHRAHWGDQATFGYKDFIPLFDGRYFDADTWVDLFRRAGAQYVVPVAEHHDGFAMYDSALTRWNACQMGPRRDVVGELAQALRQQHMVFGVSSHRAEHWWFMEGGRRFASDVLDEAYADFYGPAQPAVPAAGYPSPEWHNLHWQPAPDEAFLEDWLRRCCELVDKYQPQVFWFDWWIEQAVFEPYLQRFAAYYYNRALASGREVVLQHKHEAFPPGTALYDIERGKLNEIRPDYWQTDTSVSYKSWGYIEDDHFKSATTLVHDLIDIVSKNGNLLLNIGPRADGTIPQEVQERLLSLGDWLHINGEAIYNTRHWRIFGEEDTAVGAGHMREGDDKPFGPRDVRFTCHDNYLYAIVMGWPDGPAVIESLGLSSPVLAERLEQVELLGTDAPVTWQQREDALYVTLPDTPPCEHAYVLRILLR